MDRSLDVVEYVDGPWHGTTEELPGLPATIPGPDGRYVRSVRCADDGAMRYVWHGAEPGEQGHETGTKES